MDKNGARGRAHSIAASILRGIAKTSLIDTALEITDLTSEELTLVKKEVQSVADECARVAALHKAIEQGTADRRLVAHNYMNDPLTLTISEEGEGSYSVTWNGLGGCYSLVKFYCADAVEADKLFHALQTVIGTAED